jgi:DNA-binding transcriptional MerR regulator
MTKRTKTTALALTGAVALASGAYALGSQSGDGAANASTNQPATARPHGPGRWGFGDGAGPFADLADRLGVDADKLRAALEDIRTNGRDELASELAKALGIDASKVTAALDKLRPDRPHPRVGPPDRLATALAKELGISADKVRKALEDRRDHPGDPASLAKALGVTPEKLHAAFDAVLGDLRDRMPHPPDRPGFDGLAKTLGVTQAQLDAALEKVRKAHEDRLAQQLADRLNLDVAKVKAALDDLGPFERHRHP